MAQKEEVALRKKALVAALDTSRNQLALPHRGALRASGGGALQRKIHTRHKLLIGAFCLACAGTLLVRGKVKARKKQALAATVMASHPSDQKKVFHWLLAISQPAAKAFVSRLVKKNSSF